MKRITFALILALTVAACAGGSDQAAIEGDALTIVDGKPPGESAATVAGDEMTREDQLLADQEGTVTVDVDVSTDRKVIRQARLELRADNTREAFEEIVALTEASGGFVASANVFPVEGEDDQPEVTITLRIPADELTGALESIKGTVDEVVSESQDAQDVTEQYVDLEAQLVNLEALEVELRALLTEVRQQPEADPDKLLRVFNEISAVRGQIEQLRGQLQYLDDVVTLASVEIALSPTPGVVPIVEDTWQPVEVARDALRDLVAGLQRIAAWGIEFALYTLPMLLLTLALPLLVGLIGFRQWRKRRPPTPPGPTIPAAS